LIARLILRDATPSRFALRRAPQDEDLLFSLMVRSDAKHRVSNHEEPIGPSALDGESMLIFFT